MSLQTVATGAAPLDRKLLRSVVFVYREIFPEVSMPSLTEIAAATEKLFEIVKVRNDRMHYARTCAEWRQRLIANKDAIVRASGEAMFLRFERYLEASTRLFEADQSSLLRLQLRRID
jgi:cyclopropane-fatty-acyl-phospholipid synthase